MRAFIETVEQGSKPQPDFFGNKSAQSTPGVRRVRSLNKPPVLAKKPSLTSADINTDRIVAVLAKKPSLTNADIHTDRIVAVLGKKPSLKGAGGHNRRTATPLKIVSSSCRKIAPPSTPPPPPPVAPSAPQVQRLTTTVIVVGEDQPGSELTCLSEDSGHSTCELKYSGE